MTAWTGISAPKVWYSNLNWEQTVRIGVQLPQVRNVAGENIIRQMAIHQIFLADREDTVLLHERPDSEFMDYINAVIGGTPKLIIGSPVEFPEIFREALAVPYLMDQSISDFLDKLQCRRIGPSPELALRLNNKLETRQMCLDNGFDVSDGAICNGAGELAAAYGKLRSRYPDSRFVVKTAYGSSGKNMLHIYKPSDFEYVQRLLQNRSHGEDCLVSIERWHEAANTMSAQLMVWQGKSRILAVTEQMTNDVGVYKGSQLNPCWSRAVRERYEEQLRSIGQVLIGMGYEGIVGIDSVLDRQGRLLPVIEINARLTLVTYLLRIIDGLVEAGFPHIQNQYYDVKPKQPLSFSELIEKTEAAYTRDRKTSDGGYLIYGFHASEGASGARLYRLFILYWNHHSEQLKAIKSAIERAIEETKGAEYNG